MRVRGSGHGFADDSPEDCARKDVSSGRANARVAGPTTSELMTKFVTDDDRTAQHRVLAVFYACDERGTRSPAACSTPPDGAPEGSPGSGDRSSAVFAARGRQCGRRDASLGPAAHRDGQPPELPRHPGALRRPARAFGMLAKQELFRVPVFSSAMQGLRCVPIDRATDGRASSRSSRLPIWCGSGNSIVVFPEGTRSDDGLHSASSRRGPSTWSEMAGGAHRAGRDPRHPRGAGERRSLGACAKVRVSIGEPLLAREEGPRRARSPARFGAERLVDLSGLPAAEFQGDGEGEPSSAAGPWVEVERIVHRRFHSLAARGKLERLEGGNCAGFEHRRRGFAISTDRLARSSPCRRGSRRSSG